MKALLTEDRIILNKSNSLEILNYSKSLLEFINSTKVLDESLESVVSGSLYSNFALMHNLSEVDLTLKLNKLLFDKTSDDVLFILKKNVVKIIFNKNKKVDETAQYDFFIDLLKKNFLKFLEKPEDVDDFLDLLLNYQIEVSILNMIIKNGTEFEDFRFVTFEESLNKFSKINLQDYFSVISNCINEFVNIFYPNSTVFVITPFTNNSYISLIKPNSKIKFINELDFENTLLIHNQFNLESNYKLKVVDRSLQFGWLMLNNKQQHLIISKNNKNQEMSIETTFKKLIDSTCSVDGNFKLFFEFIKNHLDVHCIKFSTINNKIFYKELL